MLMILEIQRRHILVPESEDTSTSNSGEVKKNAYDFGDPKEAYSCSPVSKSEDTSTLNFGEVKTAVACSSLPEISLCGIDEPQYGASSFSAKDSKNELWNTPPKFSPCNISPAHSVDCSGDQPFDICESNSQSSKKGGPVKLQPPLFAMNREKRNEEARSQLHLNLKELKPGIIYLKNYLTLENQLKIVKECGALGTASGGFYQPSFSSGHKMHLHMMSLGKNWDPETSKYGDIRPHDGTRPHDIPDYFKGLVQEVLQVAQGHLKNDSKLELPAMEPDI